MLLLTQVGLVAQGIHGLVSLQGFELTTTLMSTSSLSVATTSNVEFNISAWLRLWISSVA